MPPVITTAGAKFCFSSILAALTYSFSIGTEFDSTLTERKGIVKMETEVYFELPVAGKEVKVLINRHCMKNMVFYSIELVEQGHTVECHFMTYDKDEWVYKFVPSPSLNKLIDKESEFSEFIFERFHNYCLN